MARAASATAIPAATIEVLDLGAIVSVFKVLLLVPLRTRAVEIRVGLTAIDKRKQRHGIAILQRGFLQ